MLRVPEFPLLESLEVSDHILIVDEVLKSKVDEDKMFQDLDKSKYICPLGPLILPPRRDVLVVLPQNLPKLGDLILSYIVV